MGFFDHVFDFGPGYVGGEEDGPYFFGPQVLGHAEEVESVGGGAVGAFWL